MSGVAGGAGVEGEEGEGGGDTTEGERRRRGEGGGGGAETQADGGKSLPQSLLLLPQVDLARKSDLLSEVKILLRQAAERERGQEREKVTISFLQCLFACLLVLPFQSCQTVLSVLSAADIKGPQPFDVVVCCRQSSINCFNCSSTLLAIKIISKNLQKKYKPI